MAISPVRPTHTGSARKQARAKPARIELPPTHERLPQAAIALAGDPPAAKPRLPMRWAQHPLPMSGGRSALAVRVHPERGPEVLVRRNGTQEASWLAARSALSEAQAKRWSQEGDFSSPR